MTAGRLLEHPRTLRLSERWWWNDKPPGSQTLSKLLVALLARSKCWHRFISLLTCTLADYGCDLADLIFSAGQREFETSRRKARGLSHWESREDFCRWALLCTSGVGAPALEVETSLTRLMKCGCGPYATTWNRQYLNPSWNVEPADCVRVREKMHQELLVKVDQRGSIKQLFEPYWLWKNGIQ